MKHARTTIVGPGGFLPPPGLIPISGSPYRLLYRVGDALRCHFSSEIPRSQRVPQVIVTDTRAFVLDLTTAGGLLLDYIEVPMMTAPKRANPAHEPWTRAKRRKGKR